METTSLLAAKGGEWVRPAGAVGGPERGEGGKSYRDDYARDHGPQIPWADPIEIAAQVGGSPRPNRGSDDQPHQSQSQGRRDQRAPEHGGSGPERDANGHFGERLRHEGRQQAVDPDGREEEGEDRCRSEEPGGATETRGTPIHARRQ